MISMDFLLSSARPAFVVFPFDGVTLGRAARYKALIPPAAQALRG